MSTLIIVMLFLLVWKVFNSDVNKKIEDYDLSKVDCSKIHKDINSHHLFSYDVKQNILNGKYDRNRSR